MSKIIFVHIGTYKTATSSIQYELGTSKLLDKAGCHYVRSGINKVLKKHLKLFDSILDDGSNSIRRHGLNYDTIKTNIAKEISNSSKKYFFISEEELSYPSQLIPQKLTFLKEMGQVRVLFVVRDQPGFLDSLYRQFIKENSRKIVSDFETFIDDEVVVKRGEFYEIAERWAECFGRDSVLVKSFDELKINNDVVASLFAWAGVPYKPVEDDRRFNESISAAESEVIRRLAILNAEIDRSKIVQFYKSNRFDFSATYLRPSLIATIREKYLDSNRKLFERYGVQLGGAVVKNNALSEMEMLYGLEKEVSDAGVHYLNHVLNVASSVKSIINTV